MLLRWSYLLLLSSVFLAEYSTTEFRDSPCRTLVQWSHNLYHLPFYQHAEYSPQKRCKRLIWGMAVGFYRGCMARNDRGQILRYRNALAPAIPGTVRAERNLAEVLVVMDDVLQVCINVMARRRKTFSTSVSNSAVKCPIGFWEPPRIQSAQDEILHENNSLDCLARWLYKGTIFTSQHGQCMPTTQRFNCHSRCDSQLRRISSGRHKYHPNSSVQPFILWV